MKHLTKLIFNTHYKKGAIYIVKKIFTLFKILISKIQKHPVLSILLFELLVVIVLFCFGFRITYNSSLDNNWEAIAACGTWFCGIVVPIAVVFIQHKISTNESNVSASNEALLQEINKIKSERSSNSEPIKPSITEDDVYRFICIKIIATTEQIATHFNTNIETVTPLLEELYFVKRKIRTCSLEDDPKHNIAKCNWMRK